MTNYEDMLLNVACCQQIWHSNGNGATDKNMHGASMLKC